jgi:hypothetical protein
MTEMDTLQDMQGCPVGSREGRLGDDVVCFDPASNVGQFVFGTGHLSVCSQSSFSTVRANACVFRGKFSLANIPCWHQ